MRPTRLRGARTNNLQGVDLTLLPGTLVAVTGPSGAGKSSLVFGTLHAEGQRRYVESFSAYARQFLERMARPPVDELDPVPAAIAVGRRAPVRTSRSTVGTMTEINDHVKNLWARAAMLVCPRCDQVVAADDPHSAADKILGATPGARVVITYPVALDGADRVDALLDARAELLAQGYRRVWLHGQAVDLDRVGRGDGGHDGDGGDGGPGDVGSVLHVIADRTVADAGHRGRVVEALEAAMHRGGGRADVWTRGAIEPMSLSRALACLRCQLDFRPATPGLFSFNSPIGACEVCRGFGRTIGVDLDKVIPDPGLALAKGAIRPWRGKKTMWEQRELKRHCQRAGVPFTAPVSSFTEAQKRWLMDGDDQGWGGLRQWFAWLESRTYEMHVRVLLSRYRSYDLCPACAGTRLTERALWWRLGGVTVAGFLAMTVARARAFLDQIEVELADGGASRADRRGRDTGLAGLLARCRSRLQVLAEVGLDYLTLDRESRTLSGGEAQRVALTCALAASLSGALIALDEPTVGLHPRDTGRLFAVIRDLAAAGNTVVVVEHDPLIVSRADRVVELGPGAGAQGGRIVFDGRPDELFRAGTLTGRALAAPPPEPRQPRQPQGWIEIDGARGHNLKNVDLAIPVGVLTCVTGVSGSGKSSLILETLARAARRELGDEAPAALAHDSIAGADVLSAVIEVDQAAPARTWRGNPATYVGAWDWIRRRFAAEPLAKERGYTPGAFSFNVAGGRCEACKGEGAETVEMQFLADVSFSCPECGGRRFTGPVLDVRHRGLDIAQVLELTVAEAAAVFAGDRKVPHCLAPLVDMGLGYLRMGQPLAALSSGEAARIKLAAALATAPAGALIVLDEPTAGLHAGDVDVLLAVLDRLVERGDTVVVIEHDMRVAARADHVIEMGPDAGAAGGRIVARGAPREVAASACASAPFLAAALGLPDAAEESGPAGQRGQHLSPVGLISSHGSRDSSRPGQDSSSIDRLDEPVVPAWPIEIRGAREHNLKNISIALPSGQLVVVTGPSGSGKSSLAFDVLYAEGQRRYLETLSPYARHYMPQLPRPAVDQVTGVPPSVSLEQRTTAGGGNSTVATLTEVAHYLRVLYARAGALHCPDCGVPIEPRPAAALAGDVLARVTAGALIIVLAPVVRGRKGQHRDILARARDSGITHARIDGKGARIARDMALHRHREHDIDLEVAQLEAGARTHGELSAAITRAAGLGDGSVCILSGDAPGEEIWVSTRRACPRCGRGFAELDPRLFSFNTRQGACEVCEGRGTVEQAEGRGGGAGLVNEPCSACQGARLSPLARAVVVAGRPITDILCTTIERAREVLQSLELAGREALIGAAPIAEIERRLAFLQEVGVGYLGLDRAAPTLSGGEMQRVRLAAQLGSGLTGVLYVLDEPTIGLHPRDTGRLLCALRGLVERGNSAVVVEHDLDTIAAADYIVDMGPGGGRHGGKIVARGSVAAIRRSERSITGRALVRPAPVPVTRRKTGGHGAIEAIKIEGAREHNLRDIDVALPLQALVVVTGVSGSGKTTLIREILLPAVRQALGLATEPPGAHTAIRGVGALRRVVEIDQSPIGRTPRSVPATYIGIWTAIRKLLASTPEARVRGYGPSRFSFNVPGGRCARCEGQGALRVEMSFLPEVHLPCDACGGLRFDPETLAVTWRGMNAGELLDLEVSQAMEHFGASPRVLQPLRLLAELGLGYLKLGQPSSTLSGGEAQRLKLVSELGGRAEGGTLYVMDEPTTGLHRDDVARVISMLHRLVDRGDTVVVIEHHPDVMVSADWIVDLGPEGGERGGLVVACGTPERVARVAGSHTGAVIAAELTRAGSLD